MNNNLSSLLDAVGKAFAGDMPLSSSFALLNRIATDLGSDSLAAATRKVESRYFYLLRFVGGSDGAFSAAKDTDRIRRETERLLATAACLVMEADTTAIKGSQLRYQRRRPEENLESITSDFLSEQDRLRTDPMALTDSHRRERLEQLATDIFRRIRATDPFTEDKERLIETLIGDRGIPSYFRELILNAVGLGMESYLQPWRMRLLSNAVASDENRIAIAAEVWIVLGIALSGRKITPEIPLPHIADIRYALLRAMIPAENSLSGLMSAGRKMQANPFGQPDLNAGEYEAIKRIQEAQMRGEDVFGSTLGRMRRFPFFNETANWFLPFHSAHSALSDIVDGEGAAVADMIEQIPVLTDGDKFAMVLSMSAMPASMRSKALTAMVDNIRQIADSEEFREAINSSKPTDKMLVGQAVTTVFRYLRDNSEGARTDLAAIDGVALVGRILHLIPDGEIDGKEEINTIRDLCRIGRYRQALGIYDAFAGRIDSDPETLCMLAEAAKHEGRRDRMISFYEDALTQSPGFLPALLGIAKANAEDGKPAKNAALLESYAEKYSSEPAFLALLGDSLLANGDVEKAIETYHNLDYISKDKNAKAPLAWAMTIAGDYENASRFFSAADDSAAPETQVRKGILLWLSGKRAESLALLRNVRGIISSEDFDRHFSDAARQLKSAEDNADLGLVTEILNYGADIDKN